MILKVCDRCGCEIKPKSNNPGAIRFGWTMDDGSFTNKSSVDAFDLCDQCMKQLVVFLGCGPKRIGMKDDVSKQERDMIKKEIDETLERLRQQQEKSAK